MYVLVSSDEGKTWPVKKVLCANSTAYSSFDILEDGTFVAYYERDNVDKGMDMIFSKFSLEWVTDDADKYEPPKKVPTRRNRH